MAYNLIGRIRPTFKGTWNRNMTYETLDVVSNAEGSIIYSALKSVPAGTALTSSAYWAVVLDASSVYSAAEQAAQIGSNLDSQIAAINASLVKKIDGAYLTTDGELCLTAGGVLVAGPFAVSGGGSGYYTPSVSASGDLSWSASHGDMPAVTTVNIKGPKGDTGAVGPAGPRGSTGEDGISVTHRWSGTTLYVTSASGTSSANLKGEKGEKGDAGEKGADGTMTFEDLTEEQRASLKGDKGEKGDTGATGPQGPQGEKGDKGADGTMTFEDLTEEQKESLRGPKGEKGDTGPAGYTPVKGTDYYTAADKAEMVQLVLAALPAAEGVSY